MSPRTVPAASPVSPTPTNPSLQERSTHSAPNGTKARHPYSLSAEGALQGAQDDRRESDQGGGSWLVVAFVPDNLERQQQHCANLQVIANVEAEKRQGPCSSLLASGHRNSTRVFGQGGPARRAPADHPAHNSSFRVRPLPPAGDTAGRPRAPWPRFSGAIANQRRDTPRCARPRSACRAGGPGALPLWRVGARGKRLRTYTRVRRLVVGVRRLYANVSDSPADVWKVMGSWLAAIWTLRALLSSFFRLRIR
ncbi:hypothetical protein C8Q70DRAFT_644361 [Cubamyces menziesii]|nr:hypothetical protein C8Q70DRAFT_644361 [Cubamyces menziesii]